MVRCCSQSWFGLSSGAQEDWKFPERLRCLETIIELRTDPRFSLNKIAEYLTATPRRRRRLILDQIRPVVYKAGRYGRARSALQRFICDPSRTVEQLKRVAVRLRDRAAEPNLDLFDVQCLKGSARAIEAFVPIAEDFRYEDAIAVPGRRDNSMTIGGVRISVTPDVSVIAPGTERRIGAVKFAFSVNYTLNQDARQYAASILFAFIEANGGTPVCSLCDSVDVFAAAYESAPRATKHRLADVEAACEEIAARWAGLVDVVRKEQKVQHPG